LTLWPQVATSGFVKPNAAKAKRARPIKRRSNTWSIQESPAVYGRRSEVSVREAKDNLSALLMRAAGGEEIIVTSDGHPKAMITRVRTELRLKPWRTHHDLLDKLPVTPDSTDLVREERDAKG
jgi:prevent-host-death family protein